MEVHLHTVAWNDLPMLDFFFAHYEPWVTRFFVHDDSSDDGTLEALAARPDVAVLPLLRTHPDSWVLSAAHIYNTSWHVSRASADWVVITNIDEHLHHPDMRAYLSKQRNEGVSAIPSLGYQMISDDWPPADSLLWRDRPMGAPWELASKLQIFDPDLIARTDFKPGRHRVSLEGNIKLPPTDDVANLHYKYMDLEQTHTRHQAQHVRLGELDLAKRWGHRYSWDRATLEADFDAFRAKLVDTRGRDHHKLHRCARWWRDKSIVDRHWIQGP